MTAVAGLVQIWMERMNGMPYMDVQTQLAVFYQVRFGGGVLMLLGIVLLLADVFALKPAVEEPIALTEAPVY